MRKLVMLDTASETLNDLRVPPRKSGWRSCVVTGRVACYFASSDRFWLNLQAGYDLEIEKGAPRRHSRRPRTSCRIATSHAAP